MPVYKMPEIKPPVKGLTAKQKANLPMALQKAINEAKGKR